MTVVEQGAPPQQTAVHTFERVTLTQPNGTGVMGTLAAYRDRLVFDSKALTVAIPDIRDVAYEGPKGVRVTFGSGEPLETVYVVKFAAAWRLKAANQAMATSLSQVYAAAPLTDAERQLVAKSVSAVKGRDAEAKVRAARGHVWGGLVVFVIGLLITVISYAAASEGGRYLFAWGALLFGGLYFIGGLFELRSAHKAQRRASAPPAGG